MVSLYFTLSLSVAMLAVIYCDCRYYLIPNMLNALLMVLFAGAAWLLPIDLLPALGTGALIFFLGLLSFHLRLMGGGDVKLLAVLCLWTGWSMLTVQFMLLTAIFGGVIVLIVGPARMFIAHKPSLAGKNLPRILRRKEPIPYGLAIASAFLWLTLTHQIPYLSIKN